MLNWDLLAEAKEPRPEWEWDDTWPGPEFI